MKKTNKESLITSTVILFWIFLVNVVAPMLTSVPTWPMYFVTIFFFTMGGDKKNIAMIFLSGALGIIFAYALIHIATALMPFTGEALAVPIILFIILALVIVGGEVLPIVFNNITFAYLTIATIDITKIDTLLTHWLLMLFIGGGIILCGALLCIKVTGALLKTGSSKKGEVANG